MLSVFHFLSIKHILSLKHLFLHLNMDEARETIQERAQFQYWHHILFSQYHQGSRLSIELKIAPEHYWV